ncbi:MAG: hypothetical protein AAGJ93_07280 [Bacteroidota bacterium]
MENAKSRTSDSFHKILVAVIITLLVGGSSPWWIDYFFPGEKAPPSIVYDCNGLKKNKGDSCDDNNPNTINDKIQSDCTCKGQIVYECPSLKKNIGDPCDDRDRRTTNERVQSNCTCIGETRYDCTSLRKNKGDSCDDRNPNTTNDKIQSDCTCRGTTLKNTFIDTRTNKRYAIKTINGKRWFAEDLIYIGNERMHIRGCGGVFYATQQNICPRGWHVPSKAEYMEAYRHFKGSFQRLKNEFGLNPHRVVQNTRTCKYDRADDEMFSYVASDGSFSVSERKLTDGKNYQLTSSTGAYYFRCRCIENN